MRNIFSEISSLASYVLSFILLLTASACNNPTPGAPKPEHLIHRPLFHNGNPLDQKIPPDAPTDPNSALYIEKMLTITQTAGFYLTMNRYAIPVYYADSTTPRYDVRLTVYGSSGYCGKMFLKDVPIPPFAQEDPGSDHAMSIIDSDRGCVYEFWGYNGTLLAPSPHAYWASAIPIESDGIYHDSIGAGHASNHAGLNGAVWPDEVASGYISHALTFGYHWSGVKQGDPVPPATHNDGTSTDADAIPEGTLVQLNPDLDLDTLDLADYEKPIARALQEFGMYLGEVTNGPVALYGVSGLSSAVNPWSGIVPDPSADGILLSNIPVDQFRVIQIPPAVPPVGQCADSDCAAYE